jgi:hypothetical protein
MKILDLHPVPTANPISGVACGHWKQTMIVDTMRVARRTVGSTVTRGVIATDREACSMA